MSILIWTIISFFTSITSSFWKKSIDNSSLPSWLFVLFWPAIGLLFIYLLVIILWINSAIFTDYYIVSLLILAWIFDWIWWLLEASILKKIKISKVLPYNSFDKIIIIIMWFLLFYWTEWYTSIITLVISIATVLVIVLFNINPKKIKLEKDILLYLLLKVFYAISTLIIWKVLLDYTTLDIFAVIVFVYLWFHIMFNLIAKKDFTLIFKQTKVFYKYRLLTSVIWRIAFIWGFFIIESSWLLVASLLSFLSLVFSIFSMKFILWDSPQRKEIILAFIVISMIWTWYYFK